MTRYLESKLLKRQRHGNLRQLKLPQDLIDFSSNDYLGLARSAKLAEAVTEECHKYPNLLNGLGSTGSRLLTGNTAYAQDLENRIALFHGYESGLLFSCGYMANVGLLSTVAGSQDSIFFDAEVHASTHDGIRLSRAKAFPFKHNDCVHLENRLKNSSRSGEQFICIESIYSTNGSKAPLAEICQLAKMCGAHLIVDEAHAIGVCGPHGRGLVAEQNLTSQVFAQVNTFGKALGTHGGIVLGSHFLKQALINFATSYIYTTALPFHALAAIKCSYDLFPQLETARAQIQKLMQVFGSAQVHSSQAHIQPVSFAGNETVNHVAKELRAEGFDVRALMSPTVKQGREILRICLHAFNSEDELIELLKKIEFYRGSYA